MNIIPSTPAMRRWVWGFAAVLLVAAVAAVIWAARPPSKPTVGPPRETVGDAEVAQGDGVDLANLDARLRVMMADPSMQGLAVAVVERGLIVFVQGYGTTAALDGEPVDEQTVFRWASLSKTVSGTLSAKLADEGLLSLADPLDNFQTSLRLADGAQSRLTVSQLLSQQTGLPKNAFDGRLEDGQDPADIRRALSDVRPVCAPGTCHTYQNLAFDTVAEIITQRTGQPYDAAVQDRLFTPLGMSSATMGSAALLGASRWARPHNRGRVLSVSDAYYRVPAAAGVNSTITDLAIWMQAQMGLRPDVLGPALLAQVQTPRVPTASPYGRMSFGRALEDAGYGLGIRSFSYRGHRLVGHSGGVSGYRATMMFDPVRKTGIVMLWNSDSGLPFRFQGEFVDAVYGFEFRDWLELQPPAPAG